MTDNEMVLAARLLRTAADEFANHGCNDFDVESTEENAEIWREIKRACGDNPDDYDVQPEDEETICFDDWCLMRYLARKLDEEANKGERERVSVCTRGMALDAIERVARGEDKLFIDANELCARHCTTVADPKWSWKTLVCNVPFITEAGWKIVVFQDGGDFDYIDRVTSPDGATIEYSAAGGGLGSIASFAGIYDSEDSFLDAIENARVPDCGAMR